MSAESAELAYKWIQRRKNRYFRSFLKTHTPYYTWDFEHLLFIQERLELAIEQAVRGETVRLMFFMPPRHGKSSLITERFPAYCLHKRPYWKIIIGAHNETKAVDFTRKLRRITQASDIRLSDDKQAAGEWETVYGGGAKAAGMQTGIIGWGANLLIADDPVRNRADANSKGISDMIYDEFIDSFMTRLENINLVIIVLTRWSELDLAGRLLADDKAGWEVYNVPAIASENDILGRKEGEALCPDLIPLKHLEYFRDKRPRTFESLYQGNPGLAGGNIFFSDWFKYHTKLPDDILRTVFSVDTAFKEKTTSDYSCIGTWRQGATMSYLDDVITERMIYPKLKQRLVDHAERESPDLILIEDKVSGTSLIQDLQNSTRLPIVPVQADTSKLARAHAATGQFESGNISFRKDALWLADYETELLGFDTVTYDDRVDMTTQYINTAMKPVDDFIIV